MTTAAFTVSARSPLPCLAALAGAAGAWALVAWCVVFARPVDLLPVPAVWGIFVGFGVAAPVAAWNRIARIEVGRDKLTIRPEFGRPKEVAPAAIDSVVQRGSRMTIRLVDGELIRFASAEPERLAAAVESFRLSEPTAATGA